MMNLRNSKKGFTLIELMIVVAILGVLAAVAIPAFMRYIKKAKTSEAQLAVRKMFDGAAAYYVEDHTSSPTSMQILPPQFPTQVGAINGDSCFANYQGGTTYTPATDRQKHLVGWQQEAVVTTAGTAPANDSYRCWDALAFSITDPTYFGFEFAATNDPNNTDESTFTAFSYGNLDGDSNLSTFARAGVGDAGEVVGAGGLYIESQLE